MIADTGQFVLDSRVLVLNKHYMAVRVITARRAVSLLFRELAEVIFLDEGEYCNYNFQSWCEVSQFRDSFESHPMDWISTVKFDLAVPRIIRLLFYDKLPRSQVKLNRRNVFARDRNCCQYCGKKAPGNELSLDHVTPRSMGGGTTWDNLVCACTKCNARKGGRTPKQANMRLVTEPVRPRRNPVIHVHLDKHKYISWKQFLDNAYWSVELK